MWNTERDSEKEKVGNRPAKLNEKKSDRRPERELKCKWDIFLLEEQLENFVVAVGKIRNASGYQGENERQSEKWTRTRAIFPPQSV